MDKNREEFQTRQREIFRVEAAEHLEAITAGLLAIERGGDSEYAIIVQRIFREVHSLKGAARSVSLAAVVTMCQEIENIFAAMERRDFAMSAEISDAVHSALGVLNALCKTPGAAISPDAREQEQRALAALMNIVAGIPERPSVMPAVGVVFAPPSSVPQPVLNADVASASADTVRVSMQKLGTILIEAEELVGAKLAGNGRATELRALAADLAGWNQRRLRETVRQRRGQDGEVGASELLESELLFTRMLENSLRKLAGAAHQDALSLAGIADRLLDGTKKLILLPCSYLFGSLPGIVRELSREQGKQAVLLVSGEDIEIDRRVLDELKDPLTHLLRNCVDHGIEKPEEREKSGKPVRGSITITVKPVEGNRVEIAMADDGSGIDAVKVTKAAVRLGIIPADEADRLSESDAIDLVFHSGLSTSRIITDLSGRGLGLAIVREKVEKLGGTIALTSTTGVGTSFRLLVPLSLATFRGVLVAVADRRFVIPTANVVRVTRVKPDDIKTVENRQTIAIDERAVALVRLRDVLELSGPDGRTNVAARPVVVVRVADRQIAFLVDEVLGEQEVMVKGLGRQLARVRNISGASVSARGAVVPIINAFDLVESAIRAGAPGPVDALPKMAPERRGRLLIAEDSITSRTLVKIILEGAGYEVVATVDGMDALNRLKTESFDLLVSDVDMPRMNGFELTTKIRADKKIGELPIVLVTALGSQKDREYGIEVGANAYILKSDFDQSNLLEIIRRLL